MSQRRPDYDAYRARERSDRPAKRIPEILALLGEMWMENPDLRLGQIIGNASITYYTEDDNAALALTQWRDYSRDRKAGIIP